MRFLTLFVLMHLHLIGSAADNVTWQELSKTYSESSKATDLVKDEQWKLYAGKEVGWVGVINNVGMEGESIYVLVAMSSDDTKFVRLNLLPNQRAKTDTMEKNDKVIFSGKLAKWTQQYPVIVDEVRVVSVIAGEVNQPARDTKGSDTSGKSPADIAKEKGRFYGLKMLQYKQSAQALLNEALQAAQQHDEPRARVLQQKIQAQKREQDRTEAEGLTWAQSVDQASRNIFIESYQNAQSGK